MKDGKWIKIKFKQLFINHQNPVIDSYFSITFNQKIYFSTVFDDELTLQIKNDIIIHIDNLDSLDKISLQRWQSHVVVFDQNISLIELKTKTVINKKYQVKKKQVLTLNISLCTEKDIIICESLNRKTIQHYLSLENIRLKQDKGQTQKRANIGACYFQINTSQYQLDLPVINANCLISLPETFQISQFRNNKLYSKSKKITFQQLSKNLQQIQLFTQSNQLTGKIQFKAHWLIDLSVPQPNNYLLINSVQFLLYDFQIKFQIQTDFVGSKMNISCNNRLFQFNDQLGNSKMIRIKKIIWIVTKNSNDPIQIKIQRNGQIISKLNILIENIIFYDLIKFKEKLIDANNPSKNLGTIKFNLQKSKGMPNIQNQQFWKDCVKKKSNLSLLIQQCSLYYEEDQRLQIVIKTQNQQKKINKIQNINFFEQDPLIYHNPILITSKPDEIIYFMVKNQINGQNQNNDDFIGIGIMNANDIKIGKSPYQIEFYKNQQKIGTINCLITKYAPLAFVKSIFQPQILPMNKTLDLKLSMNTLTLSPYFFSYKYQNKNQVFCIIEVNKLKKVLILQPTFQQLSFIPASSSDNLSFSVDIDQLIKIKVTIMVGDGITQVIYGTRTMNIKLQQLREKQQINFKDLQFNNFIQTYVGKCNLNIKIIKQTVKRLEKQKSKEKLPFKGRNRSSNSKKDIQQKRKSISVMDNDQKKQIKIVKNLLPTKKYIQIPANMSLDMQKIGTVESKSSSRYNNIYEPQQVKLPKIKQPKSKQSFNDLMISMNVRKKTLGGYAYNLGHQDKNPRQYTLPSKNQGLKEKSIDYKILKNNSNIDRNFQLLFPPKRNISKEQSIKNQLNKYQQKLKGLKSVLQQISNDIDPIQPSIKDNGNKSQSMSRSDPNFQYAGNQFI